MNLMDLTSIVPNYVYEIYELLPQFDHWVKHVM